MSYEEDNTRGLPCVIAWQEIQTVEHKGRRRFNNAIAAKHLGALYISAGGHKSVTTKERLNGLPGVEITQKRGVWYLNGVEWDGKWINTNASDALAILKRKLLQDDFKTADDL